MRRNCLILIVGLVLGAGVGVSLSAQMAGHTGLFGGSPPLAAYSPGVDTGELVFLSGQIGRNPDTGELHDGVQAQARQALSNLEQLLGEAGLERQHVVRATVYLVDIDDYGALNEVYGEFFEDVDVKPARSTIAVRAIPAGASVEIDFIAAR